jgi:CBS domain-containing protein
VEARDLAVPYPTVRMDTDGVTAARLLTEHGRPGLIVVDEHGHPIAVLPGSQVMRALVPRYVQDDPTLAGVLEEEFADRLCDHLAQRQVAELIPTDRVPLPIVGPDATAVEIAALMAAHRTPLVAVTEGTERTAALLGAVTVSDLLGRLLPA